MPPTTVALALPSPPGLAEATKNSTTAWQHHLDDLFRSAKDRFPDVVWELTAEDDEDKVVDEVWGHKAIVYARAPPSFQSRYFSFRPNPITSPTPYSQSPTGYPSQSAFSLALPSGISRSPSPFRAPSPSTLNPNTSLLRISTSINPALFSNELEYLYTGQGFGEAFEFLFDSSDSRDLVQDVDAQDLRIDKLRKDLVFMWRSRLYSDVKIALSGNFSSSNHESTTAIFSSHRFILVSRCPYFHTALVSWPTKQGSNEPPTLNLPSPPFTPPSLHFTLGFIYTGTLVFSHRTYDLSTAFAILRAALYLSLTTLHDEIQARIAHEMLHGLSHAFLSFQEYERLTGSKWGTGGCRCRQCARRVPRVLEFSLEEDVKNIYLERGARRALVGLYGEGWCTQEFTTLNPKLRESLLKGVAKRTTPQNVFPLLFSAEHALVKLSSIIDPWADISRDMISTGRKYIDEVICKESEASFSSDEWMEIMDGDGGRFDDAERVQWAMAAVMRGVKESWAAALYQTLVSSILLRPHPTEPNSPFLSSTSQVRQQVEQTRIELLKWISKRWLQIRQEHGFDALEGWAIKEISDYMEVPIDDLLSPAPPTNTRGSPRNKLPNNLLRPASAHPHTSRIDADSEAASSMRVSVLSRNMTSRRGTASIKDNASVHSSASSVRSARTSISTSSAASDSTIGRSTRADTVNTGMSPARRIVQATRAKDAANASASADAAAAMKDRPDSKLTPSTASTSSRETSPTPQPSLNLPPEDDDDQIDADQKSVVVGEAGSPEDEDDRESVANSEAATEPDSTLAVPVRKTVITRASLASVASRVSASPSTNHSVRNKSSAASVRSQASAARRSGVSVAGRQSVGKAAAAAGAGSARPVSRGSTRASTASTISRTSTARSSVTTSSTTSTSTSSSRPLSSVSTASTANHRSSTVTTESTGSYRTASSGLSTPQARSRKSSAASAASVRTAGPGPGPSPSSPISPRARKVSGASVSSVNSTASSSAYGTAKSSVSKGAPVADPTKLSPAAAKAQAKAQARAGGRAGGVVRPVRSVSSIKKAAGIRTSGSGPSAQKGSPGSSAPVSPADAGAPGGLHAGGDKENEAEEVGSADGGVGGGVNSKESEMNNANGSEHHKKTDSTTSTGSNATIRKRRSTETVIAPVVEASRSSGSSGSMEQARVASKPQPPLPIAVEVEVEAGVDGSGVHVPPVEDVPRGATLEIGIPCIVSSKRKRFRAYARYIGEVEGEHGPWVGVEVPIPLGESWADRDVDSGWQGTLWNDGTWGGIRYFEIGSRGADWDYSYDDRATRRRRVDGGSSVSVWSKEKGGLKREGEQLVGMERMKRMRSVSPAVSDASGAESRGLFVRPQQVLYVVDAVEDL